MAETIKIGGELESTATGNIVAAASAIKDKVKNMYQGEINAETDASLADRYTKAETYNKTELNNMVTTPEVEYVNVEATDQTTDISDVLPATGAADTIYKIGSWDGSQYDTSKYSEYTWNGSAYVYLATRDHGVDDKLDGLSHGISSSKAVVEELKKYNPMINTSYVAGYLKNDSTEKVILSGTTNPASFQTLVISLSGTETIKMTSSTSTIYVFAKNFNNSQFTVVDWQNERVVLGNETVYNLNDGEHDGAKYLLMTVLYSGGNRFPSVLDIDGLDYTTNIAERVKKLEDVDVVTQDEFDSIVGSGYSTNLVFNYWGKRTFGIIGMTSSFFLRAKEKVTWHLYSRASITANEDAKVYFMATTTAYKGMYDVNPERPAVIYAAKHLDEDLGNVTLYEGSWTAPQDCYVKFKGLISNAQGISYDTIATAYQTLSSLVQPRTSYGYLNSFYLSYVKIEEGNIVEGDKPLLLFREDNYEYNISMGNIVQINKNLHVMYYNAMVRDNGGFPEYYYKNVGSARYSKVNGEYVEDADGTYSKFIFEGSEVYAKVEGNRYTKVDDEYIADSNGAYVKVSTPAYNSIHVAYSTDGFHWTKGFPANITPPDGVTHNELFPYTYEEYIKDEVFYSGYGKSYHGPAVVKVNDNEYPYRMIVNEGTSASNYSIIMLKSRDGFNFVDKIDVSSLSHDAQFSAIAYGDRIKVYLRMWMYGNSVKDQRQIGVLFIDLEGNIISPATTLFGPGLYTSAATRIDDRRELLFPTLTDLTPSVDKCWYSSYFVNGDNVQEGPELDTVLKFGRTLEDDDARDWIYEGLYNDSEVDKESIEEHLWGAVNPGFVLVDGDIYLTYIQRNNSHGTWNPEYSKMFDTNRRYDAEGNLDETGTKIPLHTEVRLVKINWVRTGRSNSSKK